MYKFLSTILVSTLILSGTIYAADSSRQPAGKAYFGAAILPMLQEKIDGLKKGDTVEIDQFFITDQKFQDTLRTARRRGVNITAKLDRGNSSQCQKDARDILWASGIEVKQFNSSGNIKRQDGSNALLHAKRILINYADGRHVVIEGSYNISKNAATKNDEMMVVTENDKDFFAQHKASQKNLNAVSIPYGGVSPAKMFVAKKRLQDQAKKKTILITPRKKIATDSIKTNILETLTQRIKNAGTGDSFRAIFFSMNDANFKQAIIDFKKRGGQFELIVDKRTVLDNPDYFKELRAHGVLVYVSMVSGLQHNKFLAKRDAQGNKTVVVTSGNVTDSTDSDFNHLSIFPSTDNTAPLYDSLNSHFDEAKQESIALDNFLTKKRKRTQNWDDAEYKPSASRRKI